MAGKLAGRHILVVEDDYFIASDITRALVAEDAVIVGPVGQLAKGLALADGRTLDAAVLDVNLGDTMTYPIADRLMVSATPWVFVTGYDGWSMPAIYRDAPRLAKPFAMRNVVETVVGLVTGGAAA